MAATQKTKSKKGAKKRQDKKPTTTVEPAKPKKLKPKPGPGEEGYVERRYTKRSNRQPNTGLLDEITGRRPRSFHNTNSGPRMQEPWQIAKVENLAHFAVLQLQKRWFAEELIGAAHAYVSALFRPVGYYPAGNKQRTTQEGDLKFIEDKLFFMNSTVAKQVRVVVAGVILQVTAQDSTIADLELPCLEQDWFIEAQAEALAFLAKTDTSMEGSEKVKEPELAAA